MKVRVVLLFVALALLAVSCNRIVTPELNELSTAAIQDQYIVVLKPEFAPGGHAANQARAAEIARGLGLSPRFTYGTALFGFAATIPEGRLNGIRRDPRVAYVDADAVVTIAGHKCPPHCSTTKTGSLAGIVTNTSNAAIGGATVTVDGTSLSATTASDGSYSISSVPTGTHNVTASHSNYDSLSQSATISENTTTTLNFTLQQKQDSTPSSQVAPWGIKRIGTASNTGYGIHVYIIDTGIDSDHPDLQANISTTGYAVETCKGGGCNYAWDDDHDHGTHVAGTVGAINNNIDVVGVAPEVILHAVKVLSKSGMGSRSGVIAGIDWVTQQTRDVVKVPTVANMSLGGSGSKTGTCTDTGFTGTDSYHQAICNAKNVGVVFVVAAGNDGADAAGAVPAAYDDAVITVSATTCSFTNEECASGTDDWTSWSNWGNKEASWTAQVSAPVAIAAPGRSVLSTKRGGGTVSFSGTSMASPHGAGAAALFLKKNAQQNNGSAFANVRTGLLNTAEGTLGWTNTSGNTHKENFLRLNTTNF